MSKSHINKIFVLVMLLIAWTSCERELLWQTQGSETDFLIVDGIITNQNIRHTIDLTVSSDQVNSGPFPASDAAVTVFDGENYYNFNESETEPGKYISDSAFVAVINKVYILSIIHDNKYYTAASAVLPVSPDSHLSLAYDDTKNKYFINTETAVLNVDEAAMFKVLIDWSHLPEYAGLPSDSTQALQYFYSLTTLDVNQIFAPEKEMVYFPSGSLLIQKKYSLTPDHERFIRSMLIETQWTGGLFDVNEGNVFTNLSPGALGFFGASSVYIDSLVIE
jgi:hypothetical protein